MDNGAAAYRRFVDGDEKAFEEIVDLYANNLIFFLNRYVRNVSVAQELSEDVFVELLLHKHRYNYKTSFKTYLFSIARHKALDYLRRCSRRPETAYEAIEDKEDSQRLEDSFAKEEDKRALHEALNKLPEDYRTALHLIYFEDMSYEQAGSVMKKNRKQIENLVYRGKKSLKTILTQGGYIHEK